MVDRIVPATTDDDRKLVLRSLASGTPGRSRPSRSPQWVIEDRFLDRTASLRDRRAQLVSDVQPFELMKLRMLNGSHSTLAYLGYLAGYELSARRLPIPRSTLIYDLMTEEVMTTLPAAAADLATYRDALLDAFRQPGAEAPHVADRHGWQPKAAAAAARDHSRSACPGASHNARGAGRCRMDALCHRHRRTWRTNRRERPAGSAAASDRACCRRSAAEASRRTTGSDRNLRRRPPKKRFLARGTCPTPCVSVRGWRAFDG